MHFMSTIYVLCEQKENIQVEKFKPMSYEVPFGQKQFLMKEVDSKALAFGTDLLFSRVATDLFSQQWT